MTTSFPIDPSLDGPEFQFTSLTQGDRGDIVALSGNPNTAGFAYVDANQLELTALGANTDLLGRWNPPLDSGISLIGWHHIAVTGRDVYVKVVHRGWMLPTGHQAVLIELFERVIEPDPVSDFYATAYLGKKTFVRILQPTKSYPAVGQPYGTNDWPFQSLRILTTVSPQLDGELTELTTGNTVIPGSPGPDAQALILTYGGGIAVPWTVVATDLAGAEMHLQLPLVFVFGNDANSDWTHDEFTTAATQPWVDAYNAAAAGAVLPPDRRTVMANGQKLRYAPEAGGPAGGTTHPVVSITLGAASPAVDPNTPATPTHQPSKATLVGSAQPAFYPVISQSSIRLKVADVLSGRTGGFNESGMEGVRIQYYPDYVSTGLPESDPPSVPLSGVYAQMAKAASSATGLGPGLDFPSNNVGGIGNPNMSLAGLSAITGPVGGALSDLSDFANTGTMDPAKYFQSLLGEVKDAALFGALNLFDILSTFVGGSIPNINTAQADDGTVTVTYTLECELQDWGPPGTGTIFSPIDTPGSFKLTATAVISPKKPPTFDVKGSISSFNIYLVSQTTAAFIQVPFNKFGFHAKTGSKTTTDVSVGQVSFIGALSFVNALESFLQDLGGSGLSIAVTPTEVDANMSLSLPDIEVGMFTLSGIAFSAGVKVPFLGDPALCTFGFASQDNPFTLTVCMFGGGGFLALGVGFKGVQTVQASFEFEGNFSLSIVVASGGLSVQAGIYYSYDAIPSDPNYGTTLTGFVKMHGELEVLGIISVSAELDLSLTYHTPPESVTGTASLIISIKIIFTISVPITVTKTWNGGGGASASMAAVQAASRPALSEPVIPFSDPVSPITFLDIVPTLQNWQQYCSAFAD